MSLLIVPVLITSLCLCGAIALLLAVSVSFIPLLLRGRFVSKLTVLDELPLLGKSRAEEDKIRGTAVICGGSVAGLFAARVCADHFTAVTIVEPEAWTNADAGANTELSTSDDQYRLSADGARNKINPRSRVLQYTTQHGYQSVNFDILRQLFPDVQEEVALLGVTPSPSDFKLHRSGIQMPTPYSQYTEEAMPKALSMSRMAFETLLRKLVRKHCPQIKFVTGIVSSINFKASDRTIVESVTVRTRLGDEKSWRMPATLVVDATGSVQAGWSRWLSAAGYGTSLASTSSSQTSLLSESSLDSLRESYDVRRWYISSYFTVSSELQTRLPIPGGFGEARFLYSYAPDISKEEPRSFMIQRIEGDKIVIGTGGWALANRAKTVDQIRAHIEATKPTAPIPEWVLQLVDMLHECEESSTHAEVRVPGCSYVKYHEAQDLPSNFVALGDAVMRLSPVWGQGCTKAAMDATSLCGVLSRIPRRSDQVGDEKTHSGHHTMPASFSSEFFKILHQRNGSTWLANKFGDYAVPSTVPCKGEHVEMGSWRRMYGRLVMTVARKNSEVALIVYRVHQFIAPPTDLFLPAVTYRVLWGGIVSSLVNI